MSIGIWYKISFSSGRINAIINSFFGDNFGKPFIVRSILHTLNNCKFINFIIGGITPNG